MKQKKGLLQRRPFSAVLTKSYRKDLRALAASMGQHYGVFFDTSGKIRQERINPNAQYDYVFRTDKK